MILILKKEYFYSEYNQSAKRFWFNRWVCIDLEFYGCRWIRNQQSWFYFKIIDNAKLLDEELVNNLIKLIDIFNITDLKIIQELNKLINEFWTRIVWLR